jgi:hypothetical protein
MICAALLVKDELTLIVRTSSRPANENRQGVAQHIKPESGQDAVFGRPSADAIDEI